jgi:hypothetical protein
VVVVVVVVASIDFKAVDATQQPTGRPELEV